jgi:hypothetical protein
MKDETGKTSIWSRRKDERGVFWKFEKERSMKFVKRELEKLKEIEPEVYFLISVERPDSSLLKGPPRNKLRKEPAPKGRPKGVLQKLRKCQHCGHEQPANTRICKSCKLFTGFWSEDIFIKRKDV